ncbi:hypothetical protein L1F30_10925 [Simiduia sp. 21SJ11W-1]|uniref:hypothetical protein n=1 Tax=Simiduia sp. 21SJ11W-1 TaxID=2909669 RepID=UPI00209E3552|nr:hypothetical protein [Simiduia sp. 21SJ11W-1]UTA46674.1 hypothetical protein L1F30_10925 [Simiduia sp. 21SJ11W-1]
MILLRSWLKALKRHYQAPLQAAFAQFKLGAMLFFVGLVLVYMAQQLIEPSVRQEAFTLAGLVIAGLGFVVAMAAHVRMLISRLWALFEPPAPARASSAGVDAAHTQAAAKAANRPQASPQNLPE